LNLDELDYVTQVLQATPEGNFEHGANILSLNEKYSWKEKSSPHLQSAMKKLFAVRENRIHPHKDDKILTSWNGLAIRAMALGYQVLGDNKYLEAANRGASFIQNHLFKDGQLLARYREGEGRFVARLEDYAYLIQGLIDLYQSDFNPATLKWTVQLQEIQNQKFWDDHSGSYYFTDGTDPSLLLRTKEGMDGALPNANAVSALNLLRLYDLTFIISYKATSQAILSCYSAMISDYPTAFSQMLMAYDYLQEGSVEIALLEGSQDHGTQEVLKKIRDQFLPNLVIAKSSQPEEFPPLLKGKKLLNHRSTFYLCRENSCQAPTQKTEEIIKNLEI
jgi:hypothetical protein